MGKVRSYTAKQLVRYNNGRFLFGIFQLTMSFMIYIEVKHWPVWYNLLVIPLSVVVLWVLGYFYEVLGIRKAVDEETAKFVINKIKKSDD